MLRARAALAGEPLDRTGMLTADYRQQIAAQRRAFVNIRRNAPEQVSILSTEPLLCPSTRCAYQNGGHPYYFDSNHLTRAGVARLTPMLDEVIRTVAASAPATPRL